MLDFLKNEPTIQETIDPSHKRPTGSKIKSVLKSTLKNQEGSTLIRFKGQQHTDAKDGLNFTRDLETSYESDFQRED